MENELRFVFIKALFSCLRLVLISSVFDVYPVLNDFWIRENGPCQYRPMLLDQVETGTFDM